MLRKMMMVVTGLAVLITFAFTAQAEENLFNVERMVTAADVEEREPVGVAETFSADIDKVFCFIEARNIQRDTTVKTVWYHGEEEAASVELGLGEGPRWRTFASVNIGGRTGDWRVDLLDETGSLMQSVAFRVE